ncbi:MAG: glycosyltransferase family 4 protein [Chitinophagaceae bacterium]|nr:glycosyltransferase family 4 protein [Chitinophagaceae bacterium]
MTASRKKIVFISHDASLTGAPILLFQLIKLLVKQDLFDIRILLYRGGTLEDTFKATAPTLILKSAGYNKEKRLIPRIWNYLRYRVQLRKAFEVAGQADILFCNTLATGPLLKEFHTLHKPVVTYVHELGSVIHELDKDGGASFVLSNSTHFIAPSEAVSKNLMEHHGIPAGKLSFLNYFLTPPDLTGASRAEIRQRFFLQWNIPWDKLYVVGMGITTFRKGIDLFLAIARETYRHTQDAHFIWIGDYEHEESRQQIFKKIAEYELSDRVTMTGKLPYSPATLIPFDLLALTSREDPYPLVMIEAAYAGVPTLCFDNTGGAAEFTADECGWAIPGNSVEQFAATILSLCKHRTEIAARGAKARKKALMKHAGETLILQQFTGIIRKVLNK